LHYDREGSFFDLATGYFAALLAAHVTPLIIVGGASPASTPSSISTANSTLPDIT
jgi:hypothetical protein